MLDFYRDVENKGIDYYPIEENYVGSFELEEFKSLFQLSEFAKKNGISFHFFEDMILSKDEIRILKKECTNLKPINRTEELALVKFLDILNASEGYSLVAYCD